MPGNQSNHYFSFFFSDAKAQEAAQSGYYDPNNPHYAYVPPPSYVSAVVPTPQ